MRGLTAVIGSKSQVSIIFFFFSLSDSCFVHLMLSGDTQPEKRYVCSQFKKISASSIPVFVQHFKTAKVSSCWIGSSQTGND